MNILKNDDYFRKNESIGDKLGDWRSLWNCANTVWRIKNIAMYIKRGNKSIELYKNLDRLLSKGFLQILLQ